jgi:hypothetical protein
MTKQQIIEKFFLYLDDMSELSTSEASDLFDKQYRKVNSDRPWEGTKKEHTATASGDTSPLPEDFLYLTANNNYTDSSELAGRPVVFVGATPRPFHVVSFSDRRQYRNKTNVCWIDIGSNQLKFASPLPTPQPIEFDYHSSMPALTNTESPWFPEEFHDIIYHAMCIDDFIINQSEKAKSYAEEHQAQYTDYLRRMAYWNSRLIQM